MTARTGARSYLQKDSVNILESCFFQWKEEKLRIFCRQFIHNVMLGNSNPMFNDREAKGIESASDSKA
jgi:hypothetical protein